jgi:hypothetical protein
VAGNGAQILRVPDPPANPRNLWGVSDAYSITILWDDGPEDGGSQIIDYRLWYDQGSAVGIMTVLEFAITERQYQT